MANKEVNSNKRGYTILENDVLDNPNLNMQEQSLLIALISYHHKEKGYAYPNYEQLKLRSKIKDNRTLSKNINSLIEKKFIKKETIKGRGCKYYINLPSGELHHVENSTTCKNTLPPSGELHYDLVENSTTTITNTITNKNTNIYSSLENELDTKEIEKDLITKINSKYPKDLIKEEFEKLKEIGLSELDLLKELDKNLKSKIKDNSNQDIEEIWSLYPLKKGKASAIKKIPKLLKEYGKEQIIRCIDRYIKYVDNQRKNGFSTLKYKDGSTFFNSGYMDYLDCNYQEDIITKPKEEPKRRGTNLDDL